MSSDELNIHGRPGQVFFPQVYLSDIQVLSSGAGHWWHSINQRYKHFQKRNFSLNYLKWCATTEQD